MRGASVFAIAVVLMSVCGGCVTTRIVPPQPSGDDVSVFVTDYGRHSSVLLPTPQGHYNEYAFGDFNWFALSHTTQTDAAHAMLWSAGGTLGRRQIDLPVDDPAAVASDAMAYKVIRLRAARAKVDALIEDLDADFYARYDTVTWNTASAMWFVRSGEPYNALHNCNHLTARWLKQLGCEIRGSAMFSKFTLAEPRAPHASDNSRGS
jgi:hypothetical protein